MFFSTYLYLIFIIIFYFESIFLNNSELFEISSWVCWTFFFNSADDFASLKQYRCCTWWRQTLLKQLCLYLLHLTPTRGLVFPDRWEWLAFRCCHSRIVLWDSMVKRNIRQCHNGSAERKYTLVFSDDHVYMLSIKAKKN